MLPFNPYKKVRWLWFKRGKGNEKMHFIQVTTKKKTKEKLQWATILVPAKNLFRNFFVSLNGYGMLKQRYTMALCYFTSLYMSFCTWLKTKLSGRKTVVNLANCSHFTFKFKMVGTIVQTWFVVGCFPRTDSLNMARLLFMWCWITLCFYYWL